MKIIEKEFNVITGKEYITEREETLAEKKERELFLNKILKQEAEAKAKVTQRQAILDRLGLTSEEMALLLS
jgi:hypothetical protein